MLKHLCLAFTVSTGLLLAGCGGGGGGGGDGGDAPAVTAVPLSITNYDDTAMVVAASVAGSVSVYENFVGFSAGAAENEPTSSYSALGSGKVDAIARFALDRVLSGQTSKLKSAAVETGSDACPYGGTLSFSLNDADNNGVESAGDSLTLDASNCVVESGQPPVNGRLKITINSLNIDANGSLVSASLTLAFTNFSSDGFVLNGSVTVSASPTTLTLAYSNFSGSYKGDNLTYNFSVVQQVNVYPNTLAVNGSIVINGSSYELSTPVVIRLGNVSPEAGVLRIADRSGNRVDVVMSNSGFVSNLYLSGDEVVDASTPHLWSEL